MLETLRNAFKIKDIRKRIIFTFLMLVVIRIGSQLPIPGVDSEVFANWFASQTADGMGFFDAVTGGSFLNLSIFALNITPYITSSIIMQLLTIAIPKLEEMQRDGEDGRKKIAEITRYLTVAATVSPRQSTTTTDCASLMFSEISCTIGCLSSTFATNRAPPFIILGSDQKPLHDCIKDVEVYH